MEFLKQKAKAHWLKEADTNTAYFHSLIKARRSNNFIHHIADHKGGIHKEETCIQQAFLEYYQMRKTCTNQHTQLLMSPITAEEIKNIIFHIPNDKAPGPDGYSSKFFKDSWDIIGHEITEAILDFFQSEQFRKWIMQCVTTVTYSLNLNGNVLVYSKGKEDWDNETPLSPLLFTIYMEYLTRLLAYTTEGPGFKYHHLWKPLKLTHLMFVDDLLLFCKGDAQSIMTILRTFSTFSMSSGLNMSKGKFNA
ncbi:uncharacterized protein LOC141619885 [Silene latifolia]|uniref:uncharacterized protein LOC141619885 n=1 Tax=Silene latifolia TaxID=37657 RepID=UPI003D7817CB